MSASLWCNRHDGPFNADDPDHREVNEVIPEHIGDDGKRRPAISRQRHICGDCMRREEAERQRAAERRRKEIAAELVDETPDDEAAEGLKL